MLSREDYYMIKQMHEQGIFQVDIAQRLGCSTKTVQRYLALPAPRTGKPKVARVSKLERYKAFIDQQLAVNIWNAQVIFQQIKALGYTGGTTLVREYIQPKRALRPSRKTVRFETKPGYQLQHDWGEMRTEVAGQARTVSFAVNTLGYSRRFHVWASFSQDAEHTYESLIQSFHHFAGVPHSVLVDNQKAAVLKHAPDGQVTFNEGFQLLARHYGFTCHACRPMRPRTKGKTERMVGYVKHNFFARYRAFESLEHLNQLLSSWLATVADQRRLRQFQQSPAERFSTEAPALTPLPMIDFDTSYFESRQVGWDGFIEVRGNRYSVPEGLCGQRVNVRIALDGQLRVLDSNDQLIATHRLKDKASGWQIEASHHQALWQHTLNVQRRDLSAYEEVL